MPEREVAGLPMRQFRYLVAGLSDSSRYRQWITEQGRRVDDETEAARLMRSL